MNLQHEQENFIKLIENNFIDKPEVTTEFLDLDKFKNDFTLFVDFSEIKFEDNKLSDDCQEYGKLNIQCYLVLRNDTPKNLNNKLLAHTDNFYHFLKEYDINTENIDFYNFASGTKYIVASEFSLILDIKL
jgi:hypothetical protein